MKRSNLQPPAIIFSVSRHDRHPEDNRVRSYALSSLLDSFKINFKEVTGRCNGFEERSFVILAEHEGLVRILANESNQDSYLYLDEYRNAYLVDLVDNDETRRPIGKYTHTFRKPDGDYTRDGEHYYEVI